MSDFAINNDENKLRVNVYRKSETLLVSVDNPENKCDRNNYEGDFAGIEISFDQAKALAEFLRSFRACYGIKLHWMQC